MKTLRFNNPANDFPFVVAAERIVYLDKKDEDITLVHLDNGEVLETDDSMNTIESRMAYND